MNYLPKHRLTPSTRLRAGFGHGLAIGYAVGVAPAVVLWWGMG